MALSLCCAGALRAQPVTIWLENFSGPNQGWTDNFTDCDGDPLSFAGVQNGHYEVRDMEGAPCCPPGGGHDNEWLTNSINIAGYCNVTITADIGGSGPMGCVGGGPFFGCTGNPGYDNSHDQILMEYSLNGGPWTSMGYACGSNAWPLVFSVSGLTGSTLQVRCKPSNNANNELLWFDNVKVVGSLVTMNQPADITVCSNQLVNIPFTGAPGATYTWATNNPAIGLPASGSGNISFTTSTVPADETATVIVTPALGACPGPSKSFTITVHPVPTSTFIPFVTACEGDIIDIPITGTPQGAVFNWTNNNPLIGLPPAGSGNIHFTGAHPPGPYGNQTGFITITPSIGACTGPTQVFTITVSPHAVLPPLPDITVCGGSKLNLLTNIPCCAGPYWFFVTWHNDNTNVGISDPFYGAIKDLVLPNPPTTEIAHLTVSGDFLGCASNPTSRTFTLTLKHSPMIAPMDDVKFCGGEPVNIHFASGSNAIFPWTNDNPAIGLVKQGTGDLIFTAADVTAQEVGTVSVVGIADGCPSPPEVFTITVDPTPKVDSVQDIVVCSGEGVDIAFTGSPDAEFNWTNNNLYIGLKISGTGDISFKAADVSFTQVATFFVTPKLGDCFGKPRKFTVTVKARPKLVKPNNIAVCEGQPINVNFISTNSPTITWTNTNTDIGLASSGTGNNIHFTAANTPVDQTGTITLFPESNGCPGQDQSFDITVYHIPTMIDPPDIVACAGDPIDVNFSGTGTDPAYNWVNTNPAIGLFGSGEGDISFTAGAGFSTQTSTVTITPVEHGCVGPPQSFKITISPIPTIVIPQADIVTCAGSQVLTNFIATPGSTINWTNDNTAVGLADSGTGNVIFTSATVTKTEVATITYTPQIGICPGEPKKFKVTVHPTPVVAHQPSLVVCGGNPVNVVFSGTPGTTFNWTNSNPAIGLADTTGSGNISFTAPGLSTQQKAFITVTPVIGPCTGLPQTFSITINPGASVSNPGNLAVCAGQPVGVAFTTTGNPVLNWTNSNVAIGLDTTGTGNIDFVAPAVDSAQTGIIAVTPTVNGCTGPTQTFQVTINPSPAVDTLASVSVCTGDPVSVLLNGTPGAALNWTNSNPAIGLPATGSGNIQFNSAAVATAQSGTITVTPVLGTCTGAAQTFDISVNPGASVSNPGNKTVCGGDPVQVHFAGSPNADFTWTNSNPAIGLPASGTGPLDFSAAINGTPQVATITVTPAVGSCVGAAQTFTITVNPGVSVANPGDRSACVGDPINVAFTGAGNPVFAWTNDNPAIGLAASGTGNFSLTAPNVASTQIAHITVTPQGAGCPGAAQTFTITVGPAPVLAKPNNVQICADAPVQVGFNTPNGVAVNWTNSNPAIGLAASGSGALDFTAAQVATAQTATITATPVLGSCTGNPVSFNVTVQPAAVGSIGGNLSICNGASTVLTASGGATYQWNGNQKTAAITVQPAVSTVYTVTVTNAGGCSATATAAVDVHPTPAAAISGTTVICNGETAALTASGGNTYLWNNNTNTAALTVSPASTTTYTVTVTDAFTCTAVANTTVTVHQPAAVQIAAQSCNPSETGVAVQNLQTQFGCDSVVTTTTTLLPSNLVNRTAYTCNPNNTGSFVQNLSNQFGCDSTVVTTVLYDPLAVDTTVLHASTCDPAQVGATQALLTGADGCDSLIITQTALLPSSATQLSKTTCNPNNTGVFVQNLTNQFGCDSTVVTTVTFDPGNADTTLLQVTTCDPTQTGTTKILLTGADGCDSLLVINTTLLPSSTTHFLQTTCDPGQAGVFTQLFNNQAGCDSTVVTTIVYDPSLVDTTFAVAKTCNPAQVGVTQALLSNANGCDSLVITTTTLLPGDTTYRSAKTCNPAQVGVTQALLSNAAGCDSLVITTTTLSQAADTTYRSAKSCDPAQVGVTQALLSNAAGCDSLVITTTTLLPASTVHLTQTTCDPGSAGTFTQHLQNQFGCDSTVITAVSLVAADTVQLTQFSCDTTLVGTALQVLQNQGGCDSIVITQTLLDPNPCAPTLLLSSANPGCTGGGSDGSFRIQVKIGTPPLQYQWAGDNGRTGSGQIASLANPVLVNHLPAGAYTITVTDVTHQTTTVSTVVLTAPVPPEIYLPADTTVVWGHAVRIAASTNLNTWSTLMWQPLPDPNCAQCLVQEWLPLKSQTIAVSIQDTAGCTATARVQVFVEQKVEIYIPNAFSPDGDGVNDTWLVDAGPSVAEIQEVQVFDRWGNLMYRWNTALPPDQWPGWDGKARGKKAGTGVYVYSCKVKLVDGESTVLKGSVTILGQ